MMASAASAQGQERCGQSRSCLCGLGRRLSVDRRRSPGEVGVDAVGGTETARRGSKSIDRVTSRPQDAGYRLGDGASWCRRTCVHRRSVSEFISPGKCSFPRNTSGCPPPELEAELIRLTGLKVWVTYWRSEPVLSQMLF